MLHRESDRLPGSFWLAFRLGRDLPRDTLIDGRPSSMTPTVGRFSALQQRLATPEETRREAMRSGGGEGAASTRKRADIGSCRGKLSGSSRCDRDCSAKLQSHRPANHGT
jgi:hypothetical protein